MTSETQTIARSEPPPRLPLLLAGVVGLNPVAMDAYIPAIDVMASDFAVGIQALEVTIAIYMLGYTVGLLAAAPMSDRLGRRPVCLTGVIVYTLASGLIVILSDYSGLVALRIVQGIGAGISLVNVGAIVRDLYNEHDSARQLARIYMLLLALPLVAPVAGAWLLHLGTWRWIFVALTVYGAVMLLVTLWRLPETVGRRGTVASDLSAGAFLKSHIASVLTHRRATFFALSAAFAAATLFLFLNDAAFLYLDHFGVSSDRFPLYFGVNVVAMAGAHATNLRLLRHYGPRTIMRGGLVATLASSGWALFYTLTFEPSLPVMAFSTAAVLATQTLIVNNAQAAYMSRFNENAGMANALIGSLIFLVGALASLLLAAVHNNHPSALAAAWLVTSVLALAAALVALREAAPSAA
ncbi:MAG: Bcr/CflA family efflux MFS transporter [Pseudomonadota bacterium]